MNSDQSQMGGGATLFADDRALLRREDVWDGDNGCLAFSFHDNGGL